MMIMAQGANHLCFKELDAKPSWVIMERPRCDYDDSISENSVSSFSGSDESSTSDESSSSSSLDLMEDSSSATSSSNGPLYELSELMSHLPIKRGLSKYYEGRSQSFTTLASVKSGEDLVKKENPYRRKRKSKSYGDVNKYSYSPKATIAKKVPRGRSFLSSSLFCKKSPIHVQKSF